MLSYKSLTIFFLYVTVAGNVLPFVQGLPNPCAQAVAQIGTEHGSNAYPCDTTSILEKMAPLSLAASPSDAGNSSYPSSDQAIHRGFVKSHKRYEYLAPALVLFLLFSALVFTVIFYGQSIRRRILERLAREPEAGPGFGYDGLTRSQTIAARTREEQGSFIGAESDEEKCSMLESEEWSPTVPEKPPATALKYYSLPPLEIPGNKEEHVECTIMLLSSSSTDC